MTTATLPTKRAWLAGQTGPDGKPLAKEGPGVRGRFSHAAQSALAKAIADGMVFADDQPTQKRVNVSTASSGTISKADSSEGKTLAVSIPKGSYDAKAVRAWAVAKGMQVGERGRIHADIITAYIAENGELTPAVSEPTVTPKDDKPSPVLMAERGKPVKTVTVAPPKVRVRPENEAWGYFRRGPEDQAFISEPLTAITRCYKCNNRIGYCPCDSGPVTPKWMGSEVAMLTKPVK